MATHYAVNPQTGERIALIDGKWVPAVQAGSSSGAPRLTEAQAKDGFNAKRITGAEQVISGLEKKGYDAGLDDLQVGPLSVFGSKRQYDSAALEWADGILRMTTGAAATKQEMDNTAKTYFPRFGDSKAVRDQKAAARARVERDAMTRAGPAGIVGPGGNGPPPPQTKPPPRKTSGFRVISVE